MNNLSELINAISETLKDYGLNFEIQISRSPIEPTVNIDIFKRIKLEDVPSQENIINSFDDIILDISSSPFLKRISDSHHKEITELQDRIKQLEQYETYYKLHYELNNGNKYES